MDDLKRLSFKEVKNQLVVFNVSNLQIFAGSTGHQYFNASRNHPAIAKFRPKIAELNRRGLFQQWRTTSIRMSERLNRFKIQAKIIDLNLKIPDVNNEQ